MKVVNIESGRKREAPPDDTWPFREVCEAITRALPGEGSEVEQRRVTLFFELRSIWRQRDAKAG